ncbi:MAG: DUF2934 domain-containing protein [Betaproteobacteria bacterium]
MAKHPPRSESPRQPDPDPAASPAEAAGARAPRRRAPRPDASPRANAAGAAPAPSDTFAARPEPETGRPADLPDRPAESTSMASDPSNEDIRMRAYHLYLERGGRHGRDFDDWVRAERELRMRSREE